MTAGDLAVVIAAVLCCIGFTALIVVLVRVLDTLRSLRAEVATLRAETGPLLLELRESTRSAGELMTEARHDLDRFDRVRRLGRGDQQRGGRQRPGGAGRAQHAGHQDRRAGHRHDRARCAGCAARARRTGQEEVGMMKRVTWFVGGVAAGAVGAGAAKRKVKSVATELTPVQVVAGVPRARCATAATAWPKRPRGPPGDGRPRSTSCGPASTAASPRVADEIDDVETVLVDGRPVEPGQVIVLRQVRDDPQRSRRRA